MLSIKLEAPWYTYQKKLNALFSKDPDIKVGEVYESDSEDYDYGIDIEIKNHEKFVALDRVLLKTVGFANIVLQITLFDEENSEQDPAIDLFKKVFEGNPIVKDIKETIDRTGTSRAYVRFEPDVVQFFDDDLGDYNGNWNGLAQDIAKEVFSKTSWQINFCTAEKDNGR